MSKLNFDFGQSIKSTSDDYYKIIQTLGEGKSATAYLALKTSSNDRGTFYVVKVMQHPTEPAKAANFNNEKEQLKKLIHSSIMKVKDEGTFSANAATYPFYICDFYSQNLSDSVGNPSIKLTQKLSYAIQMCSALAYLAANNIVHCDVKPANIYTDDLNCVLADFGLSRISGGATEQSELPSLHKYRSPDIVAAIKNNTPLTPKSDVFQLGLVLSELFTGSNPCLKAESGNSKVFVDDIQVVYGKFGSSINRLLEEMLTLDAAQRPDADSLIDRWQGILFNSYDYILKIDRNVF